MEKRRQLKMKRVCELLTFTASVVVSSSSSSCYLILFCINLLTLLLNAGGRCPWCWLSSHTVNCQKIYLAWCNSIDMSLYNTFELTAFTKFNIIAVFGCPPNKTILYQWIKMNGFLWSCSVICRVQYSTLITPCLGGHIYCFYFWLLPSSGHKTALQCFNVRQLLIPAILFFNYNWFKKKCLCPRLSFNYVFFFI